MCWKGADTECRGLGGRNPRFVHMWLADHYAVPYASWRPRPPPTVAPAVAPALMGWGCQCGACMCCFNFGLCIYDAGPGLLQRLRARVGNSELVVVGG